MLVLKLRPTADGAGSCLDGCRHACSDQHRAVVGIAQRSANGHVIQVAAIECAITVVVTITIKSPREAPVPVCWKPMCFHFVLASHQVRQCRWSPRSNYQMRCH